jgi:hypothetical protein
VTLTATVADAFPWSKGTPTGTVSFYSGTTLLGTGTLTAGTASRELLQQTCSPSL